MLTGLVEGDARRPVGPARDGARGVAAVICSLCDLGHIVPSGREIEDCIEPETFECLQQFSHASGSAPESSATREKLMPLSGEMKDLLMLSSRRFHDYRHFSVELENYELKKVEMVLAYIKVILQSPL